MNVLSFAEITVGLEKSFSIVVDAQKMEMFLRVSGDDNPLHIDTEFAIENGFQGRVVYGLLTSAFYSTLVGVYLPGKYALLHAIEIQFSQPVYIGDTLTIVGKVNYMNTAYEQIEIAAYIENQNAQKVSKAKIKVGFVRA